MCSSDLEVIEAEAFLNVEYLERVYLPKSLKEIEEGAFIACGKLEKTNEIRAFPDAYMEDWDWYNIKLLAYLIYNDPVAYAELILNGNPEAYLKTVTEYKSLY